MRLLAMAMMLMAATCCLADETAYEISLDFSVDGEKTTIDLDGRFIDVMAKDRPEDQGIVMSFWIGKLDGGVRKLLATPSIVVRAGQRGELKVRLDDQGSGMKQMALAVTAQRHSR